MPQLYPLALYGGASAVLSIFRTAYSLTPDPDGSTAVFTVQGAIPTPAPDEIDLYLNGQWLDPLFDYDLDASGLQFLVTLESAPQTGDILMAVY